jgi:ubiquinone biosynthesis protein
VLQGAILAWAGLRAALDVAIAGAARWFPGGAGHRDAALRRAVDRGVDALGRLKGAFAKLGQLAAVRVDALPPDAVAALAALRDSVPPLPFERIRAVVEEELGRPLETVFAEFEPTPLGAASIAQAHRARLANGDAVVVKVQYPWLAASLDTDLRIARGLFALFTALRHRAGRSAPLFREFCEGVRDELDFEREARVAGEIAANLDDDPGVLVPEVIGALTTRRVLTMRHHPAVPISDRDALARLGVAPRELAVIVARAYSAQVFRDGLFHADPHPGNLFVVDEPGAAERPRVLFIDFGLSRRLDPALRRELRQGVFALMQRDLPAFLDGMERLDAIEPGHREAVGSAVGRMFDRIQGHGGALAMAGDEVLSLKDEAVALLRETRGLRLPTDLLLYAKTLSYVFALGAELAPDVDMMKLCLPPLLRFLATPE